MPRHVMKGEPKRCTVGGGTPRLVASRPKAAIALGWARKNAGFFQTRLRSSSRSSGVGVPLRVSMRCPGATSFNRPKFGWLRISHSSRSLTASTVSRTCSRNWSIRLLYRSVTRVCVCSDRLDGAQVIFARMDFVIDEGRRQLRLAAIDRQQIDFGFAEFVGRLPFAALATRFRR